MDVDGTHYRTIWTDPDRPGVVSVIDQRLLPFEFVVEDLHTVDDVVAAISDMTVRGAGLIGATAGYGMALAARAAGEHDDPSSALDADAARLKASRPTAVNLAWAVDRMLSVLDGLTGEALVAAAAAEAETIADEDAAMGEAIGRHGLPLIEEIHERTGTTVDVLTHCNAGWLAFVDHGSATAPVYAAAAAGIPVHVWVDETRPRNQGARLTAWEMAQQGIDHTVIVDNAGGHLMQQGLVDLVLVGSDRTTHTGDVANKIGTYLKALAAHDNGVPFHVALPSSSIDWATRDGLRGTPIEERDPTEVTHLAGRGADGAVEEVRIVPSESPAANHAFDVTPARLVTGLVTERGRCAATEAGIAALFPEMVGTRGEGR